MLRGKSLIDPKDLSLEQYEEIFKLAEDIFNNPQNYKEAAKGKILATLFFEPSTRTRLSFESAMIRLGGSVIGFSEASSSSAAKGETLGDTSRVVSSYCDIISIRHPKEGAARVASTYSTVPVINAGDGGHQHPTQTLTDLLTIKAKKKTLSNLTIGVCGDLRFGRTVHSLIKAMARYENNKFLLISPVELRLPEYIKRDMKKNNIEYMETTSLEEAMESLDILYMTRVQRERFSDPDEYERLKDSYILDKYKLESAKKDMIILHPLPRVNEIEVEVDLDSRACYFEQAQYGVYARMALIMMLTGIEESKGEESHDSISNYVRISKNFTCNNPKCITKTEKSIPNEFYYMKDEDEYRCFYCDSMHRGL